MSATTMTRGDCEACGERYRSCAALWTKNLKCCKDCEHDMTLRPDTNPAPSIEEVQRVREWECAMNGHSWTLIEAFGIGPTSVLCSHCSADSGLRG